MLNITYLLTIYQNKFDRNNRMSLPFYITFFLLLPLMGVSQSGEIPVFLSPNGQVSVQLTVDEGHLSFHHVCRGDTLIANALVFDW